MLRKYKKPVDLPDKPLRPASGFFKYLADARAAIVKQHETHKTGEVSKIAGKQWEDLKDSEKKKYEDAYEKEKKVYDKEIAEWNSKYGHIGKEDASGSAKKDRK